VLLGGGTPIQAGAAQVLVLLGLLAAETVTVVVAYQLMKASRLLPAISAASSSHKCLEPAVAAISTPGVWRACDDDRLGARLEVACQASELRPDNAAVTGAPMIKGRMTSLIS
jgi:hypothetical protein